MGILAENLMWLHKELSLRNQTGFQTRPAMLELGNQFLYICAKPYPEYPDRFLNPTMAAPVAAKPYFEERCRSHVSVDLNGNDGALPLDLAMPIDIPGGPFDVATDFGTSEHVPCLWQCFENIHRHTRGGALLLHVNPLTGNWPGHGYWYRDEEFYIAFAKAAGYVITDLFRTAACGNTTDGWNIGCAMVRGDQPYLTKEEFYALPLKKS